MLRKSFLLLAVFAFFIFAEKILAFRADTFVTFANPIRGRESWQIPGQDPLALPTFQYQESTHSAFPVTWLLRYDAVYDSTISAYFANLTQKDKNQTLGAFLEITPVLTADSDVNYPVGISIYDANRIFLSGYTIGDREKLIDTYMAAFFTRYGYYPKSVSAWHLDSYSLRYLQEKYSVLTAMNCDDQYSTDKYRLWGGYLGSAYFPDKNNSLVPAKSFNNRINLAMVRWAQRDLFNFYGGGKESLYSVQVNDYLGIGKNTEYFENLLALYGQKNNMNEFSYINIGLENDYDLNLYRKEIRNVNQVLRDNQGEFNLRFTSLADFGDWLKIRYPESSPAYFYQSTDPTGTSSGEVFWYQTPSYRIGFKSSGSLTEIIDFRVYNREIYEDFYATPNQDANLYHEIPAVIDSVKFPSSAVSVDFNLEKAKYVHSKQWDYWRVSFERGGKTITLDPDRISFSGFSAPTIESKDIKVVKRGNETIWELTPYTPYKNTNHFTFLFILIVLIVLLLIIKKSKKGKLKVAPYILIGISASLMAGFALFRNGLLFPFGMGFWGPNGHDAIFHLSLIEKFSHNPFNFFHPQIAGENIVNYHLFFDYLSGLIVRLSGISSLSLYFRVFPVVAGTAIILLLDKLLISWKYSRPERLLAFFLVFLSGSLGFIPNLIAGQNIFTGESTFWSNQSASIFLNPPFALSIVLLLAFLNFLPQQGKLSNYKFRSFLGIALLGGLLAQTKIYGFILLIGALFLAKKYKLMAGVIIIGILISLPLFTYGGESPFIFSPLWFPRSLFASFDRLYWPRLVEAWQAYEASGNFIKLGLINLFSLGVFLLGNLGMRLFGFIQMVTTKESSDSEKIVRSIIFLGLVIPLLFIQNINPWNTIQFMYYALFFLGIFTARYFYKLKIYFLIPLLFFSVLTSIGTLKDYLGFFSSSRISYTELLALDKLKDQEDGIVLSPLYSFPSSRLINAPKPLYSYVSTAYISALSGKREYLSDTINLDITGFDYVSKSRDSQRFYYSTDKEWLVNFLRENNIKYVYETRLQKIKLAPSDINLTKIFDSGEINIYKFN